MKYNPLILSSMVNEGNLPFEVSKDERFSSRHILKSVREQPRPVIYRAFLNGHLDKSDPEYEHEIIKARNILVRKGVETKANREFVEKLRKGKNPFNHKLTTTSQ